MVTKVTLDDQAPAAREVSGMSRWDKAVKGGREKQAREDVLARQMRGRVRCCDEKGFCLTAL